MCGSEIPVNPVGVEGWFRLVVDWLPARLVMDEDADFWRKT
jgi:hypothetical protein